jgi:hypothetical protein
MVCPVPIRGTGGYGGNVVPPSNTVLLFVHHTSIHVKLFYTETPGIPVRLTLGNDDML